MMKKAVEGLNEKKM